MSTSLSRRNFLASAAGASLIGCTPNKTTQLKEPPPPDYTLTIAVNPIELAPDKIVSVATYNGQFPGPVLRFKEGQQVTIDIRNQTDTPEQLHWHGQAVPVDVDGSFEEGTPFIPPHGTRRISFTPKPSGYRFYHSHVRARANMSLGQYAGLVGPVYIEPKSNPGNFDREVFLTLKEFEPTLSRGGDMDMDFLVPKTRDQTLKDTGETAMNASLKKGMPHGFEVGYGSFTINGKMLGHGEPVRVKQGERILFHILNGSATEIRSLALPGHTFTIVAMDGNPLPKPKAVPGLWLGTAERISAIVQMDHPGVWIMGDMSNDDRNHGMGIVVEYADKKGKPQWIAPPPFGWDYARLGNTSGQVAPPDQVFEMTFAKDNAADGGFNRWTINGVSFSDDNMKPAFHVQQGKRYRLKMKNASDDIHPVHLHRHSFELTKVAGVETSGVLKDVVMLGGYQEMEVDFLADNPGMTLFHCHQQLHMDFGFMTLIDYM